MNSYRDAALKILPWICTRCAREFAGKNLQQLTVHHKDGNHDNNPADGSNWELLCIYCHENEHAREVDNDGRVATPETKKPSTYKAFACLNDRLKGKQQGKK